MESKLKPSVLLVEDNELLRPIILAVLDTYEYDVLEVESGDDGLEVLQSQPDIDLLITDVRMPGILNGEELAKIARKLRPGLKVLFITGFQGDMKENWRLHKDVEIMNKPFLLKELLGKVAALVSGSKANDPPSIH